MRNAFRFTLALIALALVVATPAAAQSTPARGDIFHATIDGWETGFVPAPFIPEGRCPPKAGWILQTAGGGEAGVYGAFEYTSEHCSNVTAPTETGALGELSAGIIVLTFDDGSLTLHYRGTWRFDGDLTTGEGISHVRQEYRIINGTGVFDGARGHGHIDGVDDFHHILFDLRGRIYFAD